MREYLTIEFLYLHHSRILDAQKDNTRENIGYLFILSFLKHLAIELARQGFTQYIQLILTKTNAFMQTSLGSYYNFI